MVDKDSHGIHNIGPLDPILIGDWWSLTFWWQHSFQLSPQIYFLAVPQTHCLHAGSCRMGCRSYPGLRWRIHPVFMMFLPR
jgi:hypothetical protein